MTGKHTDPASTDKDRAADDELTEAVREGRADLAAAVEGAVLGAWPAAPGPGTPHAAQDVARWVVDLVVGTLTEGRRIVTRDSVSTLAMTLQWSVAESRTPLLTDVVHAALGASRDEVLGLWDRTGQRGGTGRLRAALDLLADAEHAMVGALQAATEWLDQEAGRAPQTDEEEILYRLLEEPMHDELRRALAEHCPAMRPPVGVVVVIDQEAGARGLSLHLADRVSRASRPLVGPLFPLGSIEPPEFAVCLAPETAPERLGRLASDLRRVCAGTSLVAVYGVALRLGDVHPVYGSVRDGRVVAPACVARLGAVIDARELFFHRASLMFDVEEQLLALRADLGAVYAIADADLGRQELEKLRVVCEHIAGCEITNAATALHMHRNTLSQWIKGFHERTGLDPRRDHVRLLAHLAFIETAGEEMRPFGDPWWTAGD